MAARLWRIAPEAAEYTADDATGEGARRTGGRWNRPGTPMLYTSTSIALSMLETFAHLNSGSLPLNRFLVRVEVPDDMWHRAERSILDAPPVGWNSIPDSKTSHDAGEAWVAEARSALLLVPSVIVPEEVNVLINPLHPDAAVISVVKVRPCYYQSLRR